MADLPRASGSIDESGAGVGLTSDFIAVVSPMEKGTAAVFRRTAKVQDTLDEFGRGEGLDFVAHLVQVTRKSYMFARIATAVAAAIGPVDTTHLTGGGSMAFSGTPLDEESLKVVVVTGFVTGTAGGVIKVSRDGGRTYGGKIRVGTASSYVIPDTGVTVTFSGTLTAEGYATAQCSSAMWDATGLAAIRTALAAFATKPRIILLCGDVDDSTDVQTIIDEIEAFETENGKHCVVICSARDRYPNAVMQGAPSDIDFATTSPAVAATVLGSIVGPFALVTGDTIIVDTEATSPETATFTGTKATLESASAEPYNSTNGDTLTVAIDGGSLQTITALTSNFSDITAATAEEWAAVINSQLVGGLATVTSGGTKVTIKSDRGGTGSHVHVTGGAANADLGFSTSVADGAGNVSNIAAVTVAEVKTIVEAATTGVTVSNEGGAARFTRDTAGASNTVQVTSSSTADDDLGFDNAVHSGTGASAANTITRSTGSWPNDGFHAGMKFTVEGSDDNDGTYSITSAASSVITVAETLVDESNVDGADLTITATELKSTWRAALETIVGATPQTQKQSEKVLLCGGRARRKSPITQARKRRPFSWPLAIRVMGHDLHISAAQVDLGGLDGWDIFDENGLLEEHDERTDGGLLAARIACATTLNEETGVFVALPLTLDEDNKPMSRLPITLVAQLACTVATAAYQRKLNSGVLLKKDKTIQEGSARRIDEFVNTQLRIALLTPGPEGQRSSAVTARLDRNTDLSVVGTEVPWEVDLRTLGYLEKLTGVVRVGG